MQAGDQPHDLDDVLDELLDADPDSGDVSVDELVAAVGKRSFGPLLVLLALIAFTPLGGIPGVPTILASLVIAIVAQLLFGRTQFWLPKFILRRKIDAGRLRKTISWIRPVARLIDKLIVPRLEWILRGIWLRIAALGCVLVALTIPPLEIVPFGGTASWAAIALFGLAVIAEDGVVALLAFASAIGAGTVAFMTLV